MSAHTFTFILYWYLATSAEPHKRLINVENISVDFLWRIQMVREDCYIDLIPSILSSFLTIHWCIVFPIYTFIYILGSFFHVILLKPKSFIRRVQIKNKTTAVKETIWHSIIILDLFWLKSMFDSWSFLFSRV